MVAHIVLDTVASSSQGIILEVQDLEAGVEILDELTDLHRSLVISESHRVDREARLQFAQHTVSPMNENTY